MSLFRLLTAPRRFINSTLRVIAMPSHNKHYLLHNRYESNTPTDNETDENEDEHENIDSRLKDKDIGILPPSITEDTPADYSHILSEAPQSEFRRKLLIYAPARNAAQQGMSKTKFWAIQPETFGDRWGNPLMGWTSTRDPFNAICSLDRFETKEQAVQFCVTRGYEYEIRERKNPRRTPKNYASTFGKRGIPDENPTTSSS